MSGKSVKIFVCTYNQPVLVDCDPFVPMQVGRITCDIKFDNCMGDDTGDNISSKNKYYSEQSGVYWVWKNMAENHPDYVGFCHYRKLPFVSDSRRVELKMGIDDYMKFCGIDSDSVSIIMEKYDAICIKPFFYEKRSLEDMYGIVHIHEDYDLLSDSIRRVSPEYYQTFVNVTRRRPSMFFPYNTYVMKWDDFCEYCSFIFPVFEDIEKSIDFSKHTGYQSRVFGYMAERLLTVFIEKNSKKVFPVSCAMIEGYDDPDYSVQDIDCGKG